MPPQQQARVALASRSFMLLALAAPTLWSRDRGAFLSLAALAGVWALTTLAERRRELAAVSPLVEGAAIGVICGVGVAQLDTILLALVLPPFVAAILGGPRISAGALVAELVTVLCGSLAVLGPLSEDQGLAIVTWGLAGLGFGLIGSFVHASAQPEPDELAPYRDAQRLIRQLLDLSGDLSAGLDVTTLAGTVLSDVGDALPSEGLGLYEPRADVLVPLATRTHAAGSSLRDAEELARAAWAGSAVVVDDHAFAFPVGDSAVVAGVVSPAAGLAAAEVETAIAEVSPLLRATAVKLDTALLFSSFRDAASADVRQRLAREMHDGVAQDIASLGYLVDALAARPSSDKQAEQFAGLRARITAIVAEVRQSVLMLRTSIGEAQSLGAAVGAVARHLSESSQIPIQVTLDEHAARLRPEVEAELFRITQEAMNNAVKHARCTSIEVHCQVHAPDALITVCDDGVGLQVARSDSHGLKIMRERARLVGADLSIDDTPGGGLTVAVRLTSRA